MAIVTTVQREEDQPDPEELSHLSFPGMPRRGPPETPYEGVTIPAPPGSLRSTPSANEYQYQEIPEESIFYSTGVPLLDHYMQQNAVITQGIRFRVPTADKTSIIKEGGALLLRRNSLLQIYNECFPGEAERLGPPRYATQQVYDFFTGMEGLVARTMIGTQVTYQLGNEEKIGYTLNAREYQTLYNILNSHKIVWERVIKDLANRNLVVP